MSATTAAELAVIAEHLDRTRDRVAGLAAPLQAGDHDDAVAAIYEAERALRTAQRLLVRASGLLD
jgi:hypothetical protein